MRFPLGPRRSGSAGRPPTTAHQALSSFIKMRLTPTQTRIIHATVQSMLGLDARVCLFGSRTDDLARGGDIDLFIEVDRILENRAATASRLAGQLQLLLGDQRIDVILVDPGTTPQPIHAAARQQGVTL